jgi:hypothetical protein
MGGWSGKIRSSAIIVRRIAGGEDDNCSIREKARIRLLGIVGADHEKASSLIEMAEERARRFAHVFVPLG